MIGPIVIVLLGMIPLALIGSLATFSLFLGAVGKHFGRDTLWKSACVLSILLGVFALLPLVLVFLIYTGSLGNVFGGLVPQTLIKPKLVSIVPIALVLTTYAWLIYLAHQARELIRAKV